MRRKAGLGTPHIGPAFPETKEMDGGGALYETYNYLNLMAKHGTVMYST